MAKPKDRPSLQALAFPPTKKGLQPFLGTANIYYKFVQEFSAKTAVLFALVIRTFATRLRSNWRSSI
ncbi:hypothetical protein PybrP1_003493 [[Pythium] brassicae (nom. inval.)]|nr:hypothetical protein PybrP1_003493 [[Pythium] brassicae (nom. inval.)]